MNILFTVCGRAGSKGLENKNIKNFIDFPLPYYTFSIIDLFIKSNPNYSCDVALNTDSTELKQLSTKNSLNIEIVDRPQEFAGDDISKLSVIKYTYQTMKATMKKEYDMIIDLDITSPLRTLEDLNNVINMKQSVKSDVIFTVTYSRRNPYFNMVMKSNDSYNRIVPSNYTARQQAPQVYDMNASIYAYSPSFLINNLEMFEGTCRAVLMRDTAVLDIDDKNDFDLLEVIAKFFFNQYNDYSVIKSNIRKILN